MRVSKFAFTLLLTLCVALSTSLMAHDAQGQHTHEADPAPVSVPADLDAALMTVHIGDMSAFIDRIGGVAEKFQAGFNGQTLKALAGMQVQDPALQGLPPKGGLLVAVFEGGATCLFAEVAPAKIPAYKNALTMQGMAAEQTGNMLVITPQPGAMAGAQKLVPQAEKALQAYGPEPVVTARFYGKRFFDTMDEQIDGFVQMMESQPTQNKANIAFIKSLLEMAKSLEMITLTLDINMASHGIQFIVREDAAPGTPLARFFSSPAVVSQSLLQMVPKGGVRGAFTLDTDAYIDLLETVSKDVFAAMEMTPEEKEAFNALYRDTMSLYGDQMESAMTFIVPGSATLVNGVTVAKVKDQNQALEIMEQMMEKMKTSGIMEASNTEGIDMDMTLKKDVATYKGVSIHQIVTDVKIAPEMQDGPEAKAIQTMADLMQYKMAVVDNYLVSALGDASVEAMIDAAQSGKHPQAAPLAAQQKYGTNAMALFDVDVKQAMDSLVKLMETAGVGEESKQLQPILSKMSQVSPITAGVFQEENALRSEVNLPADFLTQMGQAVQEIQAQQMQQMQQPAGAPAP